MCHASAHGRCARLQQASSGPCELPLVLKVLTLMIIMSVSNGLSTLPVVTMGGVHLHRR